MYLEPPQALSRQRHQDPYSYYTWMRENAPVYREVNSSGLTVWQIFRYQDVYDALPDERLSKCPALAGAALQSTVPAYSADFAGLQQHLLHTDPPEHTRLRGLVNTALTPSRVAPLEPWVRQAATDLLDQMPAEGPVDLIADFAFPLTFGVICTILGVPEHLRGGRFRELAVGTLTPSRADGHAVSPAESAKLIHDHVAELIRFKRSQSPGDRTRTDLLGPLVDACMDRQALTEAELVSTAYILLLAGHDTTVGLLGNGMLALLQHPDQRRMLTEKPAILPTAVEELLRYDSPARKATFRVAAAPLVLGGHEIPVGDVVSLAIGSANRDGAHFEHPDTLDLTRDPNDHLAFGRGTHFCIGAALARLEGAVAFPLLLERFGEARLAVQPAGLHWRPSQLMRGLEALPVIVD
ncbi:cytochrome P450 [Streptomycetaceae bacterium NBC_01309]